MFLHIYIFTHTYMNIVINTRVCLLYTKILVMCYTSEGKCVLLENLGPQGRMLHMYGDQQREQIGWGLKG